MLFIQLNSNHHNVRDRKALTLVAVVACGCRARSGRQRLCGSRHHATATTGFVSSPIPSTRQVTVSPGTRRAHSAGNPVSTRSPG